MPDAQTHDHASDKARDARPVLAVDLDGTLIRSDMLHETFWAAIAADPRALQESIAALGRGGKAGLKGYLAARDEVDVTTLPYDEEVLDRIRAWRAEGGRTALVTATDARLAGAIAAHLGVFDEVHGTTPDRNLKGTAKAAFLAERFGAQGYVYIGDSSADLPVWAGAVEAISTGAAGSVRRRLDAGTVPAEHLRTDAARHRPRAVLRALRPHQWLKNLLVLIPLIASQSFGISDLTGVLAAFVALSLVASGGYVLNDLLDLGDDRAHPRKRNRPFASGALSAGIGTLTVPVLILAGFAIAWLQSVPLLGSVALYLVATTAYSVKLKRHTMVDICMLAFLFTLRIIAGGLAIGVTLSVWLLAFSMFIFFALAAVKRLAELTDIEAAARTTSRRGYRPEDRGVISQMAVTSGYIAVLVYALYINEPVVQANFSSPWLLWGVCPFLIFWISRLVLVASRGEMYDDPMVWSLTNRTSQKALGLSLVLVAGAVLI